MVCSHLKYCDFVYNSQVLLVYKWHNMQNGIIQLHIRVWAFNDTIEFHTMRMRQILHDDIMTLLAFSGEIHRWLPAHRDND